MGLLKRTLVNRAETNIIKTMMAPRRTTIFRSNALPHLKITNRYRLFNVKESEKKDKTNSFRTNRFEFTDMLRVHFKDATSKLLNTLNNLE